jgi:hypothetical protein
MAGRKQPLPRVRDAMLSQHVHCYRRLSFTNQYFHIKFRSDTEQQMNPVLPLLSDNINQSPRIRVRAEAAIKACNLLTLFISNTTARARSQWSE